MGFSNNGRPSKKRIEEQRQYLFQRQERLGIAAECVARGLSLLPQVTKIILFGSVANPLIEEVPRFNDYRRYNIQLRLFFRSSSSGYIHPR